MKTGTATTLTTCVLLTGVSVATLLLPKELTVRTNFAGGSPPDQILLNGVVRDFRKTHPDFDVTPPGGIGPWAGNVGGMLPSDRQPVLLPGSGYRVASQWTDDAGRNIAPHLMSVSAGPIGLDQLGLRVNDKITLEKDAFIDGFNASLGKYGEWGNYGADALVTTNAIAAKRVKIAEKAMIRGPVYVGPGGNPTTVIENKGTMTSSPGVLDEEFPMTEVALPEAPDLAPLVATLTVAGTTTLTGDLDEEDDAVPLPLHYNTIDVKAGGVLRIEGALHVRCNTLFRMDKAQLVLGPEASLVLSVAGGGDIEIKESLVNTDDATTDGVQVNAAGTGKLEISKSAHVYAMIVAPERELSVKDNSHLYGTFLGDSLKVDGGISAVHVDMANADAGALNFALLVREKLDIDDHSMIDGFDSNEGVYGGANIEPALIMANVYVAKKKKGSVKIRDHSTVTSDILIGPGGSPSDAIEVSGGSTFTGEANSLAAPKTIPVVAPPPMGARQPDVTYSNQTVNLVADLYTKKLKLEKKVTLNVHGARTIRVDDKLEILDQSHVNLMPGATLTVYFKKEFVVKKNSTVNLNTGNPQFVSIRAINGDKGKVTVDDNSSLAAWIQGSKSDLHVHNASTFLGSFAGKNAHVKKSTFHVDMAYLTYCVGVNDTAGAAGITGDGGITDAASFSEWYRDILGVNQAKAHAITLTRDAFGVYEYLDDDFHPIDGCLFGNEGEGHNNNFTYAIAAEFVYEECGGQFVELAGGDGAWLFIGHQLVLDLGGTRAELPQYIDLDRMGLVPGATYKFHLFSAQRRPDSSMFHLRTNIELDSATALPGVTAMFD